MVRLSCTWPGSHVCHAQGIGSGCGSYALPQPMNAWGRNMHDRKQAFRTFLENLSSTSPDEQLFRQLLQDFHDLYDDGWRHSYALLPASVWQAAAVPGG